MTADPFVVVARVAKTHGLKGEVSVAPVTGTPFSLLLGLEAWFAPPPTGVCTSRITSVRHGPRGPLVLFEHVDSITTAKGLVGAQVLVRADAIPPEWLEPPEAEGVEGYTVFDPAHGELGEIVEIIVTGANDVWVVHGDLGEVLIPVIDDVVLQVDQEAGRIEVHLLEGLLPGEGESG